MVAVDMHTFTTQHPKESAREISGQRVVKTTPRHGHVNPKTSTVHDDRSRVLDLPTCHRSHTAILHGLALRKEARIENLPILTSGSTRFTDLRIISKRYVIKIDGVIRVAPRVALDDRPRFTETLLISRPSTLAPVTGSLTRNAGLLGRRSGRENLAAV